MPGKSPRMDVNTVFSASVPPVDAPSSMTFPIGKELDAAALLPEASSGEGVNTLASSTCACTRAPAAILIFSARAEPSDSAENEPCGFSITSTAPASKASMALTELAGVSELRMRTGMGRCFMIILRKVMPSMRGISMSSVMTSGCSSRILSRAT